jgi:predicted dehydrogenase
MSSYFEKALIFGLGSIGKIHLEKCLRYFTKVIVIDPDIEARKYIENHLETKRIVYLAEFSSNYKTVSDLDLVVIANWGPQHFSSLTSTISHGARNFIVEKPMVSRYSDLQRLRKMVRKYKLRIHMNTPLIHTSAIDNIESLRNQNGLGEIRNIIVYGGAKCIYTVGIHYLSLATKLFGNSPESTSADLENRKINPRNLSLSYFGGVSHWNFAQQRSLSIIFSNYSSNQVHSIINFERAIGFISGNNLMVKRISSENLKKIDKPSRTFYPTEIVYDGVLHDSRDGIDELYRKITTNTPSGFEEAYLIMESVFASLFSHKNKAKLVKIPMNKNHFSHLIHKDWKIS